MAFDPQRAFLRGPDRFPRFRVVDQGQPLAAAGLGPEELILLVQRGDRRLALLATEMAYHHVAQGKLAGEPYLVTF